MLLPVEAAAINGDYLRFAIKEKATVTTMASLTYPETNSLSGKNI